MDWGVSWRIMNPQSEFILTRAVGVAGLLGLVPDGHAVILQFEVALLFPGTRFDFPQYGAYQHRLEVVIPPETSRRENKQKKTKGLTCKSLSSVLIITVIFWGYF